MKWKFAALLPVILTPWVLAQNISEPAPGSLNYLDDHYGFRDLKFEQPIGTCPGMKLVEDDGDGKFYTREADVLEMGEAKLTLLEYKFYKGKLACVTANAQGKTNSVALLKYLEKYYGPGQKSPRAVEKYYWFGKRVTVDFGTTEGGERCSSAMWVKPVEDRKATGAQGPSKQ